MTQQENQPGANDVDNIVSLASDVGRNVLRWGTLPIDPENAAKNILTLEHRDLMHDNPDYMVMVDGN